MSTDESRPGEEAADDEAAGQAELSLRPGIESPCKRLHALLLESALRWEAIGASVVPTQANGTKAPTGPQWTTWMHERPSRQLLTDAFATGLFDGFGIVLGAVSGNLLAIDVEGRAISEGYWAEARKATTFMPNVTPLLHRIEGGYTEDTAGGGVHLIIRTSEPTHGTKLAMRPSTELELAANPDAKVQTLIETKGEGGYLIVAPSGGRTHKNGRSWVMVSGGPETIVQVGQAGLNGILDACRSVDQIPMKKQSKGKSQPPPRSKASNGARGGPDGPRIGDTFNAVATWGPDILEPKGWTYSHSGEHEGNPTDYWCRPGKEPAEGISASVNATGNDTLMVFSTSTPFEIQPTSYAKFGAYAVLYHDGDFSAAARSLSGGDDPAGAGHQQTSSGSNGDDDYEPGDEFFGKGRGLLVDDLAQAILDGNPLALTPERTVAVYRGGVFATDKTAFSAAVSRLLVNHFRPSHASAVEAYLTGRLYEEGRMLPEHLDRPLLNVANGMLDLATGVLHEHSPDYLSSTQIPVAWDPAASCPRYEAWLDEVIKDQIDDLEEVTSTMLDPSRTPSKAASLFGPSRSGKSTYLRLMAAIAGRENVSAVTLHQLTLGIGGDRFAAANVYGMMLNTAADLSSAHVEDISIFKMLTGEDPIHANRKYGGQFSFTSRALFAFSSNELPTVGESSRAYSERIKPFRFGYSFAGREDPSVEDAMKAELPGILVRWVRAWQRLHDRQGYSPTAPAVSEEFETRSDRVRQFVVEECRIQPAVSPGSEVPAAQMTAKRVLAHAFNSWAIMNGSSKMGERRILDRLTCINGVVEVREKGTGRRGLNITVVSPEGAWV